MCYTLGCVSIGKRMMGINDKEENDRKRVWYPYSML